jgi:hypothetical protein
MDKRLMYNTHNFMIEQAHIIDSISRIFHTCDV